ncbi:hypothetical protein ACQ4PT_017126 [Festuca glaucescens]
MVAGALLLATAAEAALPSVVVLNRALPLKGVSLPELRKLDRARHARTGAVWVRKLSSPFRAVSCFEIRRRYQAEESLCDLCLHFFSAVQNSGKRHKGRQVGMEIPGQEAETRDSWDMLFLPCHLLPPPLSIVALASSHPPPQFLSPIFFPTMTSEASMLSSGGTSHRRSSGGSGSPWSQTRSMEEELSDPIYPPQLHCACKIPLCQKRSNTPRNPNRDYYSCSRIGTNAPYSCKTWIWVDLVRDYVEQLVNFQKRNLEILGKELAAARMELELKSEALICRELDMAEQGSIHHAEISELKSQLVTLQSQIKDLNSSALKFKKIRMFMYVGVCWLSSGSLPMTLAATAFAALMCVGWFCATVFQSLSSFRFAVSEGVSLMFLALASNQNPPVVFVSFWLWPFL